MLRQVTWLLLRSPEALDATEQSYLRELCERCPEIGITHGLAQNFITIVRRREEAALASWVEVAIASQLPEFQRFAAGLLWDWAGLRPALPRGVPGPL